MATNTTYQLGTFSETCLIEICPVGGTAIQYAPIVETVDIDEGDKDTEFIPVLSGGRLYKKIPQDGTTITFEGYPLGADPSQGPSQFFQGTTTYDTTSPVYINSSRTRDLFRIVILWTDDTAATVATAAITAGKSAYRYAVVHAVCTSHKKSYTDGVLKNTFVFKVPPFNTQGTSQIREESTPDAAGGTTCLTTTMSAYTTTNFPYNGTAFTWI